MRVLVVDDDPLTSFSLTRLFAIRGVEVVNVTTLVSAEEALERRRFDAVVVDEKVDGAKGLRVIANARRVDARIALFLLSDAEAPAKGADIYHIEKPWVGFYVVDIVRARCGGDVCWGERPPTPPNAGQQNDRPTIEMRPMRLRRAMRDSAPP